MSAEPSAGGDHPAVSHRRGRDGGGQSGAGRRPRRRPRPAHCTGELQRICTGASLERANSDVTVATLFRLPGLANGNSRTSKGQTHYIHSRAKPSPPETVMCEVEIGSAARTGECLGGGGFLYLVYASPRPQCLLKNSCQRIVLYSHN